MLNIKLLGVLLAIGYVRATDSCSTVCNSYGLDFEDGGTYFQNVASSANFTASEDFTGCVQDSADNVLVDPFGNQYLCNTTPMTPDSTPQEVNCPILKNQLTSGTWSMIVLSNNGACSPIDYIRSFSLNVGVQATQTNPITVTVTSTSAPVTTATVATTAWTTSTAQTVTTTYSGSYAATRTITPYPKTVYTTRGFIESTRTSIVPTIVATTTVTPACSPAILAKSHPADRKNTKVVVTIPGVRATVGLSADLGLRHADATPTARSASTDHNRVRRSTRRLTNRAGVRPRKRAPDSATVTVQDGAAGTSVSTVVITASLTTSTVTSIVLSTAYATSTVTADSNASKTATVTAAAKTSTFTIWVPLYYRTVTSTQQVTATVIAAASCG